MHVSIQALTNVEARANCLGTTRDKHSRQNIHERRNPQHYDRQFQVRIACLLLFIEIDPFVRRHSGVNHDVVWLKVNIKTKEGWKMEYLPHGNGLDFIVGQLL